jgi:hypothetical protein
VTSDIAIIYASTEMQNRIREANEFRLARAVERAPRHVSRTAKRDRRFGLPARAARPSRV